MKRMLEIAIGGFLGAILLWYVAFRIYPPTSLSTNKKSISNQQQQLSVTSSSKEPQEAYALSMRRSQGNIPSSTITPTTSTPTDDLFGAALYFRDMTLVVIKVEPWSPAADAGIQPRDIINRINFKRVKSLTEFRKAKEEIRDNTYIRIQIKRGNKRETLTLKEP